MLENQANPSLGKGGNFLYMCSPFDVNRNTQVRVVSLSNGQLMNTVDMEGFVTDFKPAVKVIGNHGADNGVAVSVDLFAHYDPEKNWNRYTGFNSASGALAYTWENQRVF